MLSFRAGEDTLKHLELLEFICSVKSFIRCEYLYKTYN